MVAPLLKQVFSPRTGACACLDQEGLGMTVYEARVVEADTQAMVQIGPALSRWV
jgi:nitrite reductase/ring-hydroxylating ferredoxin subunit